MSFNLFMLSKETLGKITAICTRLGFTEPVGAFGLSLGHNKIKDLMLCVHSPHPSLKFWGGAKTLIECLDYSRDTPSKIYVKSLKTLVELCGETRFMCVAAQFPSYVKVIHAAGPKIINPERVGDMVLFDLKFP